VKFLLATNVVSESTRPAADGNVMRWLDSVDPRSVHLSVVTFAEIRRGVCRLANGTKRQRLERWLARELLPRFDGRLLDVDPAVADEWGRLVARLEAGGRPVSPLDAFIAATALRHDLTLVTRNVGDFVAAGVRLLDPWRTPAH
jgi:predicted nucleic acid-binding protein